MNNPQTYDEWEASLPRGKTFTPRDAWDAAIEQSAKMREAVPAAVPDGAKVCRIDGIGDVHFVQDDPAKMPTIVSMVTCDNCKGLHKVGDVCPLAATSAPKQEAVPDAVVMQELGPEISAIIGKHRWSLYKAAAQEGKK